MYPVVVERRDHYFGRELKQIAVCDDILQALGGKGKTGGPGALLTPFHDTLGMLIDKFHGLPVCSGELPPPGFTI